MVTFNDFPAFEPILSPENIITIHDNIDQPAPAVTQDLRVCRIKLQPRLVTYNRHGAMRTYSKPDPHGIEVS